MSAEDADHPPEPRLTLRVGITGRRRLAAAEHDRIRGELSKILDLLAKALTDCWKTNSKVLSKEPPLLRVVCGLAEGADQLAAQVAVDRANGALGSPTTVRTTLAAILPFRREEFIKDFARDPNREDGKDHRTPDELRPIVERFDALLDAARQDAVLELDDEALLASGRPDHRDLGYVGLRDLLVQHSDIVIAIFDESREKKLGGAADVTHLAAQEGVPVIRISTVGEPVALLRAPEPDDPDQRPRKEGGPLDLDGPTSLAELVAVILSPPSAAGEDHGSAGAHQGHAARSGRKRLEDFLGDDSTPAGFAWLFKAWRAAMLQWTNCGWPGCLFAARKSFHAEKARYEVKLPSRRLQELWPADDALTAPYSSEARFRRILARRFAFADTIAICYADNTRSSYIAIASYGAAAVLVGLLSVLFWGTVAGIVKVFLLGGEGLILWLLAVLFYRRAHGKSWHERMVEYRVLAELLRHQRFIYALGGASRAERTGDRSWRGPDAWLGWYVQATIRELGFPTARLSADYRKAALAAFQRDELAEQIDYNDKERERNKAIDDALGRFIERAWRTTVGTAAAGGAVVLGLWLLKIAHGPMHAAAEYLLDLVVKPLLTIFMAFMPAMVAAVHGIRFQMEFGHAAKRAETTFKELRVIDEKLRKAHETHSELGRKASEAVVRAASDAMVADLSGWSTVYKNKAAELV